MTREERAARRILIKKLYSDGKSVTELSEKFGLTKKYIQQIIETKKKNSAIDTLRKNSEIVSELVQDGVSYKDIGTRFGVTKGVVSIYCREIGIKGQRNFNSEEDVYKKVKDKTNGLLEYVSGYTTKEKPITIRCTICGGEFVRTFHNITTKGKVTCPHCVELKRRMAREEKELKAKERREVAERKRKERERQKEKRRTPHSCPVCGELTTRPKYCSDYCQKKANNATHDARRRKKIQDAMIDDDITVMGLFKRDAGVCYICGEVCDFEDHTRRDGAFIAGERYPSIDHVIPLSKGGKHSWDNVKLAHKGCNTKIYNTIQRFAPPTLQFCNNTP